jgi:hypothetical protein
VLCTGKDGGDEGRFGRRDKRNIKASIKGTMPSTAKQVHNSYDFSRIRFTALSLICPQLYHCPLPLRPPVYSCVPCSRLAMYRRPSGAQCPLASVCVTIASPSSHHASVMII